MDNGLCPVTPLLLMLQGKWKAQICHALCMYDIVRFGMLKRELPGITTTVLASCLRELEQDGLISRKEYDEMPPRVEYSFTAMGNDLKPNFYQIMLWGFRHEKNSSERLRLPPELAGKKEIYIIDLKMPKSEIPALDQTKGIFPAYHMNAGYWISVLLEDVLPDDYIMQPVEKSYNLAEIDEIMLPMYATVSYCRIDNLGNVLSYHMIPEDCPKDQIIAKAEKQGIELAKMVQK